MKKLVIEKEKLKNNIEIVRNLTDSTIIAVLKGNGYGLGIAEYAQFLIENDIYYFAVSEISEGLKLRSCGFTNKILLMSPTSNDPEAELIIRNGIMPTIGSVNSAVTVNEAAKRLGVVADVHLKIDTGFGRFGFLPDDIDNIYALLKSLTNIRIVGTYTHFSSSFGRKAKTVYSQFKAFNQVVEKLNAHGINTGMLHVCNSSALLRFKDMHLDAVRAGSVLLGRIPIANNYGLKKVGYLKSCIIEVKNLPPNHYIGYANTFRTKKKMRIGIVPVGYKDGFGLVKANDTFRFIDILRYMYNDFRQFKKHLYVKVKGKNARILGRINMFNIVIDLENVDAGIGDEVILDVNPLLVDSSVEREFV